MKAMLMAAGRGERLRPLTDSRPKPLIQAGGKPLVDYHLERLADLGVSDVVINIAWLSDQIRDHLGSGERWGLSIRYSDEGEKGLETGGGIYRALPLLGDAPFVVINADVYCDFPLQRLQAMFGQWGERLGHLICVPNPPHNPQGDFSIVDGRLSNASPRAWTFSGISMLSPALFANCEPGSFALAPILRRYADDGLITAEPWSGDWFDVGTAERLAALEAHLDGRDG